MLADACITCDKYQCTKCGKFGATHYDCFDINYCYQSCRECEDELQKHLDSLNIPEKEERYRAYRMIEWLEGRHVAEMWRYKNLLRVCYKKMEQLEKPIDQKEQKRIIKYVTHTLGHLAFGM